MIAATVPNYQEVIDKFCDDVLSGERVAGEWEIAAVKRYKHDLDHAHERGFYFDFEAPGAVHRRRCRTETAMGAQP